MECLKGLNLKLSRLDQLATVDQAAELQALRQDVANQTARGTDLNDRFLHFAH
jgi:hypothetical protein